MEQLVNLFDLTPDAPPVEVPPPGPVDEIPGDLELVVYVVVSKALGVLDACPCSAAPPAASGRSAGAGPVPHPQTGPRATTDRPILSLVDLLVDDGDGEHRAGDAPAPPGPRSAPTAGGTPLVTPHTPLNGTIGVSGTVGFARLPLPAVRQIKAAVAGATGERRGAHRRRRRPARLPARQRRPARRAAGGRVPGERAGRAPAGPVRQPGVRPVCALLHTELVDPIARLEATHRTSQAAKHEHNLFGAETLQQWAEVADPNLFSRLSDLYAGSGRPTATDRRST